MFNINCQYACRIQMLTPIMKYFTHDANALTGCVPFVVSTLKFPLATLRETLYLYFVFNVVRVLSLVSCHTPYQDHAKCHEYSTQNDLKFGFIRKQVHVA